MGAYRDMTEAQFRAALKRNGFSLFAGAWVEHRDFPNHMLGLTFDRKLNLRRRTSLAHALRKLDELRAEQKRKASNNPIALVDEAQSKAAGI